MAKTAERKVEIAKRITRHRAATSTASTRELLIFDLLTFTLTTGDEEWRPSAVETIEGIRRIKAGDARGEDLAGRLERLVRRRPAGARGAQLRLPAPLRGGRARPRDGQPATTSRRTREIPEDERELADDLVFNRREDALERFIAHFESKGEEERGARPPTRPRAWSPRRRSTGTSCAARRTASRTRSTARVEKIGAVPTLNEVLLPAMKEVGDKFGAGELILPFVLQSAEVMKRAVAQLEKYLDKIEGYTKGTVVIATVFGDVHDIGKSLVNTILTNNGYTVVDLGKQVPIGTIIDAAKEHEADRDRAVRAARLDLQADADLRPGAARARARVPRADRRRRDQPQLRPPHPLPERHRSRTRSTSPASSTARTRSRAWPWWTSWSTGRRATALVDEDPRRGAGAAREGCARPRGAAAPTTPSRSAPRTDVPDPEPPFWGVREIPVDLDEVFPHLDLTCCSSSTGAGKGVKGEAWEKLLERGLPARAWSACGASRTTYTRARCSATSRATRTATSSIVLRPGGPDEGDRAPASSRASPSTTASAWPTSTGRSSPASATSSRSRP